ncbi:MAG: flagellar basal body P-ring protein FlgI, partial [Sedimentisphaerales bacterium]|nr:flagellar basal body P-ring protein FlgI [Sedimentisphaerales bacterium]
VMTPLCSANHADNTIYAWAQGQISIPNTDNPTSGIIKNGAVMEVDFLHNFVDQDANGRAYFDLIIDEDISGWQTAYEIALRINDINAPSALQAGSGLDIEADVQSIAVAHDPRNIRIYIPEKRAGNPAGFISQVMRMVVDLPDPEATIVINERTGTIAITGNVEITPCSVTVTGLMIRIDPQVKPQQTQWSKFDTVKEDTAKLDDLIAALDQLNVSVKQKIDVIYALQAAGSLRARIRVR